MTSDPEEHRLNAELYLKRARVAGVPHADLAAELATLRTADVATLAAFTKRVNDRIRAHQEGRP